MVTKVYVGGLPNDATSQELEEIFTRFGRIRNVWVARRPPGFAFVEYDDVRNAEHAVRALDGSRICGVRARVEISTGRRRGGGGRGGGYGGGYGRGPGGGGRDRLDIARSSHQGHQIRERNNSFYEFSPLRDVLNGVEQETLESGKKQNSKKDIEFKYWNNLNEDCRQEVVKYLVYPERCRLGICSKRDYETVKAAPMDIYSVGIHHYERDDFSNWPEEPYAVVRANFDNKFRSGNWFHLKFSQHGDDTVVRTYSAFRNRHVEGSIIWKSCKYYEEAVKFAEKWMKKCKFEVKKLNIWMRNYPFETSIIKSLPKCESIEIAANDIESFRWWLQKVPEQLQYVELTSPDDREVFTLPAEFLNAPQITQTRHFDLRCRAAFTDEQFLDLRTNSIKFVSVNITHEGINQFIKRWVNQSVSDFERAIISSPGRWNLSELTRGLEVKPWDDDFETELEGFCEAYDKMCGYGYRVQIPNRIDPYESLTLGVTFCEGEVSICATGHRKVRNGTAYTEYSTY